MESKKWRINKEEFKRIIRNALIFLAPVALVVIPILQNGGGKKEVLIAIQVWVYGVILDFFRKLNAGN